MELTSGRFSKFDTFADRKPTDGKCLELGNFLALYMTSIDLRENAQNVTFVPQNFLSTGTYLLPLKKGWKFQFIDWALIWIYLGQGRGNLINGHGMVTLS